MSSTTEADLLRQEVGMAARWLQRLVAGGDYPAVRGELLQLGSFAAPVILDLCNLISNKEREALVRHLCSQIAEDSRPRQRSRRCLQLLGELLESVRSEALCRTA